jgi:hypothetical protein
MATFTPGDSGFTDLKANLEALYVGYFWSRRRSGRPVVLGERNHQWPEIHATVRGVACRSTARSRRSTLLPAITRSAAYRCECYAR